MGDGLPRVRQHQVAEFVAAQKERKDFTAEYLPAFSGGRQPPACTSAHRLTHLELVWSCSASMEILVTLPRKTLSLMRPRASFSLSSWMACSSFWQSEM